MSNQDKPGVNLAAFREKLKEYRQLAGYSQKALADKLGLHKVVLSNKLNGTARYNLTIPEVKQIILTLVEWEAILTQKQAKELAELADLPPNVFSEAEWQTVPLSQLEATPAVTASGTVAPVPLHNLPAQLTALIGRKEEIVRTRAILQQTQTRLLTLTGTGGVGKTRLAIQVGADSLEDFRDGVFFTALAALSDPTLVLSAITQNLKMPGLPNLDNLKKYLKPRQLLLILDNFEHLTPAANILPALLEAASGLKIVITSRVVLHLPGEQLFEVLPLGVHALQPTQDASLASPDFAELSQNEAIQLFAQRTRSLNPNFALTFENARIIGQICYRLDGLPLALELAAARTRLFSLQALLERLSIGLLVAGNRTEVARHQTLQATLDWSYHLLEPVEKELFTQLAIFSGEFGLDAVTAICLPGETQPEAIPQLLNSLKDKSLIKETVIDQEIINNPTPTRQETTNFGMLEILREYGLSHLKKYGQKQALEQRYLNYYVKLAEGATGDSTDSQQGYWSAALYLELPDLRKALKLALELGEIETALRISSALGRFWWLSSYSPEGQHWFETIQAIATAKPSPVKTRLKVKTRQDFGVILRQLGSYTETVQILEEALELANAINDRDSIAYAYYNLGAIYFYQSRYKEGTEILEKSLILYKQTGNKYMVTATLNLLGAISWQLENPAQAQLYFEQSLVFLQELGDLQNQSDILSNMGIIAHELGSYEQAADYYQKALTLQRKLNDNIGVASNLSNLGVVAQEQNKYEEAVEWHEQSLKFWKKRGEQRGIAVYLCSLGQIALYTHSYADAQTKLKESLQLFNQEQELRAIAIVLEAFGGLAVETSNLEQAARLLVAAQNLRDTIKAPLMPGKLNRYNYYMNKLHTQWPPSWNIETLQAFWQEGYAMEIETVIKYALDTPEIN